MRKIFPIIDLIRGYYPKYVKNSHNLIGKDNLIKDGQKIWIDIILNYVETTQMAYNYMKKKMLNTINHQKNANKNHNEVSSQSVYYKKDTK